MKILAIETSCDDTCAAVLDDERILSNVVSSQTNLHAKWGGVVPDIAKRAHQANILPVITTALTRSSLRAKRSNPAKIATVNSSLAMTFSDLPGLQPKPTLPSLEKGGLKSKSTLNPSLQSKSPPNPLFEERGGIEQLMESIDVIAVTIGPGLAPALGVGVNTAKELAIKYGKKLVAVNHIEGHILANFAKNSKGKPERKIEFPSLVLTVSGGHTKIILVDKSTPDPSFDKEGNPANFVYKVVGETLDDAAGEALDKAAKLMGLGYPGGPVIERLAEDGDSNFLELPRPLPDKKILDYSFSGLKTSFYYKTKDWPRDEVAKNLRDLAASYQKAVFDTLLRKYKLAIEKYEPKSLMACGGVMANMTLRKQLRALARGFKLPIFMPFKKILNTDNAGMIGVAGYYKAMRGEFVEDIIGLDRNPREEI